MSTLDFYNFLKEEFTRYEWPRKEITSKEEYTRYFMILVDNIFKKMKMERISSNLRIDAFYGINDKIKFALEHENESRKIFDNEIPNLMNIDVENKLLITYTRFKSDRSNLISKNVSLIEQRVHEKLNQMYNLGKKISKFSLILGYRETPDNYLPKFFNLYEFEVGVVKHRTLWSPFNISGRRTG